MVNERNVLKISIGELVTLLEYYDKQENKDNKLEFLAEYFKDLR